MNFTDAKTYCKQFGEFWQLPVVHNVVESEILGQQLKRIHLENCWLGIRRTSANVWINIYTKKEMKFFNWIGPEYTGIMWALFLQNEEWIRMNPNYENSRAVCINTKAS